MRGCHNRTLGRLDVQSATSDEGRANSLPRQLDQLPLLDPKILLEENAGEPTRKPVGDVIVLKGVHHLQVWGGLEEGNIQVLAEV